MPVLPQIVFKIAKYLASSQIATMLDTDKIIFSVYVWKLSAGIEKIPKKVLRLKRLIEFPYSLCSHASDKCLFMALNCIFFLKSIKKSFVNCKSDMRYAIVICECNCDKRYVIVNVICDRLWGCPTSPYPMLILPALCPSHPSCRLLQMSLYLFLLYTWVKFLA